jgi:hypothetical protein
MPDAGVSAAQWFIPCRAVDTEARIRMVRRCLIRGARRRRSCAKSIPQMQNGRSRGPDFSHNQKEKESAGRVLYP